MDTITYDPARRLRVGIESGGVASRPVNLEEPDGAPTTGKLFTRYFEGDCRPVAFSARTLAMLLNVAIRVGRGTESLKTLKDLVYTFGVWRVS